MRRGFAARLSGRTLGPVEVGDVYAPAHAVRRSARQIARDTRECYKLGLVLRGSCVLRQNGRRAEVGVGDVVFYDLTRPVDIAFDAHHIFTVVIPHSAVPLPPERLAAFGGTLLGGGARGRRLVSSFLGALAENTADNTAEPDETEDGEPYAHHLGGALVELVTGTAGEWLGAVRRVPGKCGDAARDPGVDRGAAARSGAVPGRDRRGAPHLRPAAVPGFPVAGTTVARYVRARRLENCRRELGDPFLGTQRIGAIAGRWGLPDAAAFSRAFRAAYGQTPTAYRARATGLHRDD